MRTLSIRRVYSSVARRTKLKVYLEDPAANELKIGGVPCRRLGVLKNGETAQFSIGETAARVYVIPGKLSKENGSEYYPIPAGSEDVWLSGSCSFDLAASHAFRFDGVTDPGVLENRKRGSRIGLTVLIVSAVLGFLLGFFLVRGQMSKTRTKEKTFTAAGVSITLTDQFRETEYDGFDFAYESPYVTVFGVRDLFALYPGMEELTLEEYVGYEQEFYPASRGAAMQQKDGLTYLDYSLEIEDCSYHFMAVFFKSDKAFHVVNFATLEEFYPARQADLFRWARSITIED